MYKLIDAYWPGPLSLVIPGLEDGKTVGVRVPNNYVALRFLQESQCAVAATSANLQGEDAPLTCQDALRHLDGKVDMAIDGGECTVGRSSTVVSLIEGETKILREGSITKAEIDRVAQKRTVVFICTGNSCRSVMAEYLLKSRTKDRDNLEVSSAGTGVFIQSRASSATLDVLREKNIDAAEHVSQSVNSILLKKADLIFVMTRAHRQQILERVPEVEKRIYLIKEFCTDAGVSQSELDVADPIGRDHEDYRSCLGVIDSAIDRIVELL